jgi:hypothetical protein
MASHLPYLFTYTEQYKHGTVYNILSVGRKEVAKVQDYVVGYTGVPLCFFKYMRYVAARHNSSSL